ncbi:MAG TPA: triose-phosphate isomerase [Candidatus Altiarchaeales archaeon]|nr:triose-phosphate isomerase [Candidatus Altiarchaeales archaeon]
MKNIIIVNFKTYKEATGDNALNLAKICDKVAIETESDIFVAPQFTDIFRIFSETNIPIFGQHVDNIDYGSNTGHVLPESVKESGAIGCLVNHSERRLKLADMEAIIGRLRKLDMASIVCTNNVNTTKAVAAMDPDFVAIEPPELIGSGISVSTAQPEIISGSVDAVEKINPDLKVLCGAGISSGEDVKKAIELGACGVLVASGIVKAEDPKTALFDLVSGLK